MIKKGETYRTKSFSDAHANQDLYVISVWRPKSKDGWIHYRTETKVNNRKNHTARVWWFTTYCYKKEIR